MNVFINEIIGIQNRITTAIKLKFKRYLIDRINWDSRLITITGARGTGKTTLVLQHYLETYNDPKKCLYISADNPLILKNGIYDTVKEYLKLSGECVIIDEVHISPNWSIEVKALYDSFPDVKFIILGSSKLDICSQKGDLSRRTLLYNLNYMSFREYLELKYSKQLESYSLETILKDHVSICSLLNRENKHILGNFQEYIRCGAFPFSIDYNENEYFGLIGNILDKVIYEDVPTLKNIKLSSCLSLKKLIAFLAM